MLGSVNDRGEGPLLSENHLLQLSKLPIPPTSNRYLMPAQSRLIKTPEARRYESGIQIYGLKFFRQIEAIKKAFQDKTLCVDYYFIFHKSRVLTKKDTMKRLDVANRVKIIQDCVSKLVEIDDCYFVSGKIEKLWCDDAKDEQVIVVFSEATMREFKGEL